MPIFWSCVDDVCAVCFQRDYRIGDFVAVRFHRGYHRRVFDDILIRRWHRSRLRIVHYLIPLLGFAEQGTQTMKNSTTLDLLAVLAIVGVALL
jgi:hypothetical protein